MNGIKLKITDFLFLFLPKSVKLTMAKKYFHKICSWGKNNTLDKE